MEIFVRNLKILWRTDTMIAEHRANLLARQLGVFALAGLIAVFGLMALDIAIFFILSDAWGPAPAAGALALLNIAIALLLVAYARTIKEGPEMQPVYEVRNMAIEDMATEAANVQADIRALRDEVTGIKQSIGHLIRHPADALTPSILLPLVTTLLKALKSKS